MYQSVAPLESESVLQMGARLAQLLAGGLPVRRSSNHKAVLGDTVLPCNRRSSGRQHLMESLKTQALLR
jgi:hypothetical protein